MVNLGPYRVGNSHFATPYFQMLLQLGSHKGEAVNYHPNVIGRAVERASFRLDPRHFFTPTFPTASADTSEAGPPRNWARSHEPKVIFRELP